MSLQKRFYWVYARQTDTKEVVTDVDTPGELITNVIGASPYQGLADSHDTVTEWSLVGELSTGGFKATDLEAFIRGEKGDTLPLSGGDNPIISEKLTAELKSFDVDNVAWSTAAVSGA